MNNSNAQRLQPLSRAILRHDSFFFLLHLAPDGDSMGSSIGLALALEQAGKQVQVGYVDYVPQSFLYLPRSELVRPWLELEVGGAAALLCDCSSISRVGEAARLVQEAPVVFNIDHHPDNSGFGDFVYVEPEAAAVGEIVYQLLPHIGVELNREIAEALYLAILTDSGGFRYQNTRPLTHRITAELLETGVEPDRAAQEVYENRSESALRVLGAALQSLQIHDSLPVAWIVLTRSQLRDAGAQPEDTDSVVDYARSLKGIEVAFLVREEKTEEVKVSLRSKHFVDVSRIAATLGGGGHIRAAGCRLSGLRAHETAKVVLAAVEQHLEDNRGGKQQP